VPEALGVAGAGSAFGVTPSISRRPSGQTISRMNRSSTPAPPLESAVQRVQQEMKGPFAVVAA